MGAFTLAAFAALTSTACGTQDWAFDAPTGGPDSSEGAGPSLEEAGPREAAPVVDASPLADVVPAVDSADVADPTGCANDGDCSSTGLHCDVASGQCVACVVDSDCGAGRVCNALQCVTSCADGGTCPSSTPICRAPHNVCAPCNANADCAGASTGHFCLVTTGQCVGCLVNTDCRDGFCDSTTNACRNL
jgi:Cys-rich repeat protein